MGKRRIKWTWSLLFVSVVVIFVYFFEIRPGLANTDNKNPCYVDLPGPKGFVTDLTHLFTSEEISTLDSIIAEHEKQTSNQLAIITVDSTMFGSCELDEYITTISNEWGVGQKEKNNGIVIGIAASMRKITIKNGLGIETKMTNEETKVIIDSTIIPYLKNGKYFEGIKSGLFAIFEQVK